MAGIGIQPAGTSPAGFGTPATGTAPTGTLLQQSGGAMSSARRIDPRTRDLVLNPHTGRVLGMNPVQQMVQLAVHTDKGSAAVREMGNELRKIDRITPNFERRCLTTLTNALKSLSDAGYIEVLGFSAFKAGRKDGLQEGQTYGRLRWRDLTTNAEQEERI
jgi:hypothetical protein